ncbi:MAG: hypothetical protein HC905_29535 [Bacteroidales bacterium]|nr:hypothetical protein [Bacteroidales bacterium]
MSKFQLTRRVLLVQLIPIFMACNSANKSIPETFNANHYISTFDSCFREGILRAWYPTAIDSTDGGYLSNLSYNWEAGTRQPKMLVTQSRHVWTSSQAALFYGDTAYTRYARHGIRFLVNQMWDNTYGGFFNLRSKEGGFIDESYKNEKRAYGNTFAIYGLVSWYNLTKDTTALGYARRTFLWLDKHSHDKEYGGYVDAMDQKGNWIRDKQGSAWKDYNSTIHLLEAFTELYKVWPDTLVKTRLNELLVIVRDAFVNPRWLP